MPESSEQQELLRTQAIRLREEGMSFQKIGNLLSVHADTVGRWYRAWLEEGETAIAVKKRGPRTWVQSFVIWYNEEHQHSGLKFQTPIDRHTGKSKQKIRRRIEVLSAAKERHPERWGSRSIRDWHLPDEVVLNPVKEESSGLLFKQAA